MHVSSPDVNDQGMIVSQAMTGRYRARYYA